MSTESNDKQLHEIAGHIREILQLLGEDPEREGLKKTPLRAAKALLHATQGYNLRIDDVVGDALFEHEGRGPVVVRDIEFYSTCEHHILPFFGTVIVAYIPNGKILGLSKVARVVDALARKLQVQERFTLELCREIGRVTGSADVFVACSAGHLCMKMRGVEKQQAYTLTTEGTGRFAEDEGLARRMGII